MTSALGSIQISGLLGGTAGKIDTDALVSALMAAKSMPKQQLQLQVAQQGKITTAYQSINTTMQAVTSAATALADSASWAATKATSSLSSVIASSSATAGVGSTTFHIAQLAAAQVSTVKADGSGNWVGDYTAGIDVTIGTDADGNPVTHHIDLSSGSAEDIAAALNGAGIGVRAAVVNTDGGQVLQIASAKTGAANGFTISGLAGPIGELAAAADAKVAVGNPASGGYTISSSTNTFTDAMPGVTFTVGGDALGKDVTITVDSDTAKIASTVEALVDAVNSAKLAINNYTGKGGVLQGYSDVVGLSQDMSSVLTAAVAGGRSLAEFGVEITKDGLASFDADTFSAAYAADPAGTMQTLADALATPLKTLSDAASAPVTGSLSQTITSGNDQVAALNTRIDDMTERLTKVEEQMRLKYIAMQTTLAKLQSQGDWLTSMFKSMQASDKDS